jgi:acetyltransferase-like isoleucine patch superfamily enzyme
MIKNNIKGILKYFRVYKYINNSYFSLDKFCKNMFNFYLPNIGKITLKKDRYRMRNSLFIQKTLITGKGNVNIGNNDVFGYELGGYYRGGYIELQARYETSKIVIKDYVATNNNVSIISKECITIGNNCLIGHNCEFIDFDGHDILPALRRNNDGKCVPITIDDNVWFGNNCKILCGTTIGRNCIVAANSVVKGKFGENLMIGGVPARVIRII